MGQKTKHVLLSGYKSPGTWSWHLTSPLIWISTGIHDVTSTLKYVYIWLTCTYMNARFCRSLWSLWELCFSRSYGCGFRGTPGNIGHPTSQQNLRHSGCGWWLKIWGKLMVVQFVLVLLFLVALRKHEPLLVESSWNVMAHGDSREVKGKLANGVGSQYPSHYLGTWCIQHYYRWCAHLGCQ